MDCFRKLEKKEISHQFHYGCPTTNSKTRPKENKLTFLRQTAVNNNPNSEHHLYRNQLSVASGLCWDSQLFPICWVKRVCTMINLRLSCLYECVSAWFLSVRSGSGWQMQTLNKTTQHRTQSEWNTEKEWLFLELYCTNKRTVSRLGSSGNIPDYLQHCKTE